MTIRKLILMCGLVISLYSCASFGTSVTSTSQAVNRAVSVVDAYNLVSINKICLGYDVDNKAYFYVVRVRKLNNKTCGGDPDVEPTLFFLRIMKANGQTTTTAYDTDGSFEPLSHKKESLFYEK